jgi:hypothetical protein
MALDAMRVNVGAVAVALNPAQDSDYRQGMSIVITNRGADSVDLGGSAVATGAGYELGSGETFTADLQTGEVLYAVGPDAGPRRLDVLLAGV